MNKQWNFAAQASSIAEARRCVRELAQQLQLPAQPQLELLISEVATNAVRYGHAEQWQLQLQPQDNVWRVQVISQGQDFQWQGAPSQPSQTSGRGLWIVDQLAEKWGVEQQGSQVMVWLVYAIQA